MEHTEYDARARWSQPLRVAGRRVTKQRLAILECATSHPHSTADELHRHARLALPGIALGTVHTVVNDLAESGLLRRLDVPHTGARYETRITDHHHAVCTQCGLVEDVALPHTQPACLDPTIVRGMKITVAEVLYHGLCASCAGSLD
ncbi:transcriptional repressor [Glutamicibacter sp. MNS18]|uniref:Fur family transcriptional regulator n=1 Tax=Glutamicibacter sp. MNS18 TaxID=2989817 RepID=UPI0022362A71|nr:Fur family transcriptional regulator [Glutamicibacter sp. MNS18]MCW4465044.1 transcriptional repressor [Glutamicibacter sp. MNS18]